MSGRGERDTSHGYCVDPKLNTLISNSYNRHIKLYFPNIRKRNYFYPSYQNFLLNAIVPNIFRLCYSNPTILKFDCSSNFSDYTDPNFDNNCPFCYLNLPSIPKTSTPDYLKNNWNKFNFFNLPNLESKLK